MKPTTVLITQNKHGKVERIKMYGKWVLRFTSQNGHILAYSKEHASIRDARNCYVTMMQILSEPSTT